MTKWHCLKKYTDVRTGEEYFGYSLKDIRQQTKNRLSVKDLANFFQIEVVE